VKRVAALLALFAALSSGANAATIVVSDAWSRPAIDTGVVYVRVRNSGAPDRLVGARSPVARAVEVHRSMEMSGSMNGMAMNGVSSMERVPSLPVQANGTLVLAPGGAHIMLIGLRHDLHAGTTFPVALHFARAGWVGATVHVRPI
jgi:periplasmic copper chaperone A